MKIFQSSVTTLISICVLVFILVNQLQIVPESAVALYFPENNNFRLWQFVSSIFTHGSLMHILFNMYALWAFGSALEQIWGGKRFLVFFFISGLGAGLIYTLVNYYQFQATYQALIDLGLNASSIQAILDTGKVSQEILIHIPEQQLFEFFSIYQVPAVGASGAIYGILIAYAITYPNAKLFLIFLPLPIKAMYFVPLLIGSDLFFGMTNYSVGNIAHFAHVGGAIFGLLMMLWWNRKVIFNRRRF